MVHRVEQAGIRVAGYGVSQLCVSALHILEVRIQLNTVSAASSSTVTSGTGVVSVGAVFTPS